MRFYIFILFLIGNSIYAQSLFENQKHLRKEKTVSIYIGQNSISYYYSLPFLGASYSFDSKNEIGFNLVFSKFSSENENSFLPYQNNLLILNEKYSFKQNTFKAFYNYFLFDSPIFLNATIGSLPEISTHYSLLIFNTSNSNFSELNINLSRKASTYFSPGLGFKIILENGAFFSILGGPMYIYENQLQANTYSYLATNSDFQNISSTLIIDFFVESKKKDLFRFSGRNSEAYIDFSAGISF
ncbi:MAG: hypothetical protein GPI97_20915 [Microcystis aeruginosa W13-16]|nr:hypothetical protein [Microcystis aeruginosa W13-16]